jgi:hypothetical protein
MIKDLADELNISDEKTSGPEEEEVDWYGKSNLFTKNFC